LWKRRPDVLANRELRPKAHRIVVKNPESRRPEEYLVRLRIGDRNTRLKESVGTFSNQLAEHPPVPFVGRSAPLQRTIAIDQTVVEHIGAFVAVVPVELGEGGAEPNVV